MSATTFPVIALMVNSAQGQTMENVSVESVHVIQNGMFLVNEVKVLILRVLIKFYLFLVTQGYTACECRASTETCMTPYGEHINKLCSGKNSFFSKM